MDVVDSGLSPMIQYKERQFQVCLMPGLGEGFLLCRGGGLMDAPPAPAARAAEDGDERRHDAGKGALGAAARLQQPVRVALRESPDRSEISHTRIGYLIHHYQV
jgi:hypothetical protein